MALGQGTIFTASEAAKALRENATDYQGQNPWTNAYNAVNLQKNQALDQLDAAYSKQLNDAYLSSLQQTNIIRNSNLGQGYQDLALKENEALLNQAFESYRNTYLQNKGTIEDNAAGYVGQIDQALMGQGTNQAKLGNMALSYLSYLYDKDSTIFDNDPNYGRFLVDDNAGGKRLMTTEKLSSKMFNPDGSLNDYGIDYLDFIESYQSSGNVPSFGDYLAEKDSALFDWATSEDPHNAGRSNAGTFRHLTGDRTEKIWSPNDAIANDSIVKDSYDAVSKEYQTKFETGIKDLKTKYDEGHKSEGDAEAFMTDLNTQYEALKTYAKQIGAYDETLFNEFEAKIVKYNDVIANPGDGNNRKNREYATSNAFADYEQLFNRVFGIMGGSVERTWDYEKRKNTSLASNPDGTVPSDWKSIWSNIKRNVKYAL